jgi:hypothetical protein
MEKGSSLLFLRRLSGMADGSLSFPHGKSFVTYDFVIRDGPGIKFG